MLPHLLHAPGWTRLRRAVALRWPMPALVSDVREVIYLSWWIAVEHAPPPPPGHHYMAVDGRTPYTILTYRHGHFGPALAGPLRRLLPSPLQSNWRWYLRRDADPAGTPVVLFDRNVMEGLVHVAGARAFSDAMQPHLPALFEHVVNPAGDGYTRIEAGQGGAPSLHVQWQPDAHWNDAGWTEVLGGREALLRLLTCQDEAIAATVDGRWAATRIALPVATDTLRPLRVTSEVQCARLQALGVSNQQPLAMRLPQVPFRVVSERLL